MFLVRTRSPTLKPGGTLVGRPYLFAVERRLDIVGGQLALERLARPQRMAGRQLVGADQAALDQHVSSRSAHFL